MRLCGTTTKSYNFVMNVVFSLISQKLFWLMKLAQKSEFTPQKCLLNTNIYEFLMKRIGSPKNGNIRIFFAKCRESSVRAFRKKRGG